MQPANVAMVAVSKSDCQARLPRTKKPRNIPGQVHAALYEINRSSKLQEARIFILQPDLLLSFPINLSDVFKVVCNNLRCLAFLISWLVGIERRF